MDMNDAYPSKYLKASDLQGKRQTVIMADVKTEEVGQKKELRPILYFKGKTKGVVLNKTNARKIIEAYGPQTDDWFGQPIELYEAQVEFQGDTVPAIRVAISRGSAGAQTAPAPKRDEWATQTQAPVQFPKSGSAPAAKPEPNYGDLDNSIPF